MKEKTYRTAVLALALCAALAGCGKTEDETSSVSMPDESAVSAFLPDQSLQETPLPYINPLTGVGCEADIGANRPVAIMLNNLKRALPQLGLSQADMIYEIEAEGGITRLLAVFQDAAQVGELGSVRSARDYYVSIANGLDAIFMHAGGSPKAYEVMKNWDVNHLDCVNGPYEGTLYWRDAVRKKSAGYEHSVLTSGEKIGALLPTYKSLNLQHKSGYPQPLVFLNEDEQPVGEPAGFMRVPFSTYKTGLFTYDEKTQSYLVAQDIDKAKAQPVLDGNTDTQLAVKNVLVLRTDIKPVRGDEAGRLDVRTTGSGSGYFLCDGVVQPITWTKNDHSSPFSYTDAALQPLKLGIGSSYICIVRADIEPTISAELPQE